VTQTTLRHSYDVSHHTSLLVLSNKLSAFRNRS